jgi:hypothetical protein
MLPGKGQLEPLLEQALNVIDREASVRSDQICHIPGRDKRESFHFDFFVICFWLVQSQSHFGPASAYAAYKNAKRILLAVEIGCL